MLMILPCLNVQQQQARQIQGHFFILSDCKTRHIAHLDVYQGKNASNIDIHESVGSFPTTQKAVLNAVIQSGIANDPRGSHVIVMDNCYAAPELFVVL